MEQTKNEQQHIVEIENISFSYGKNEVLRHMSLAIPRGDYLGVIGPNGAGKTTFLNIVLGLLPPKEGSVKLFGKPIAHFKDWNKIGYVPQKATSFDQTFPATVIDVVLMGRFGRRGLFHSVGANDRKKAEEALQHVGLLDYKDRLVGDLSGGQQQRVFIARALAGEPEIIFFDEPTVGVDQSSSNEFYGLLKKLNEDFHITVVLITHDIERVVKEVKHIACIDRTLVCHSLPEEFEKDTQARALLDGDVKIITHAHHS